VINNNSNINKYQNTFNSKINNYKDSNSTNINNFLYHSNKNFAKEENKIKNNINNSSLKSLIKKKDFKMISPKNHINAHLYNCITSLSNYMQRCPIYSSLNIDNNNYLDLDTSYKNQNQNLGNKNIKILYINNNFNYLKNTNTISHFSNQNIKNDEGKYSLQINKKSKLINSKNKNIFNQSPLSNSSNSIKLNRNITYKSKIKTIEKDLDFFSEYKTSLFDNYFENN
jgi:hypothetical protein